MVHICVVIFLAFMMPHPLEDKFCLRRKGRTEGSGMGEKDMAISGLSSEMPIPQVSIA